MLDFTNVLYGSHMRMLAVTLLDNLPITNFFMER